MFDWPRFLDQHNIEYITSGRTAAGNNIAINCPLCAHDESFYLSISTTGKGWHCWRSADHKGVSPTRLIQALIGCTWEAAARYSGEDSVIMSMNQLASINERSLAPSVTLEAEAKPLKFPSTFRKFPGSVSATPYVNYLASRDISVQEAVDYNLHYCTHGDYRGRIIFPIFHDYRLVTWTGRSISDREPLRYKDAAQEETGVSAKDYLMFYDYLCEGGDVLVLTEGPFDALKVNILAERTDILATCSMTSFYTERQRKLLYGLLPRFNKCIILLDQGAHHTAMRLQSMLKPFTTIVKHLPSHRKDPAQVTNEELAELLK